jgi:transposase
MEATGGYGKEMALWLLAMDQALKVAIAQPVKVHHFAQACGLANKTDLQDAIMLARFGELHKPPPFQPMSETYEKLRALTRERAAMVKAAIRLGNRNEIPSQSREAQKVRERMIANHEKAIADLEKAMKVVIQADPALKKDCRILQTIPGVADVVAPTLMGELGDLRSYPHPKTLPAYTGIAPKLKDSGSSVHETAHMTKHGSSRVRHVLYMAAMASLRGNNTFSRSYDHLVAEGKPPMVAIGAIMRKMLVVARVLLITEKDYDPNYVKDPPSEGS